MKRKFKIHVYPAGQLGNQLFQLASAITVYYKNIKQNPRIVWHADDEISRDITKLIKFSIERRDHPWIKKLINNRKLLRNRSIFARGTFKLWWILQQKNRPILEDKYENIDFEKLQSEKSCLIRNYHQDYQFIVSLSNLPPISETIEEIVPAEILGLMRQTNPICVHMRFGDYLDPDVKKALGELSGEYYSSAISVFDENLHQNIWLFSDDTEKAALKLMTSNLKAFEVKDFNLRPVQELALLALSANKVLSNSTFSWWAGYLSPKNSKTVVPAPLTIGNFVNSANQPNWIKVPAEYM